VPKWHAENYSLNKNACQAFGFNGILFDGWRDDAIGQVGIADALVTAFDIAGEVFADEAVKQRAKHLLLEIPAINGAPDFVGDLPGAALQFGTLLGAGHFLFLF